MYVPRTLTHTHLVYHRYLGEPETALAPVFKDARSDIYPLETKSLDLALLAVLAGDIDGAREHLKKGLRV